MHPRCLLTRTVFAAVVVWLMTAGAAVAEPPANEFWPEVDTWLRLSSEWRLSLFVPISENLDTHYREGNLIAQADYEFGKPRLRRRLMDEDRARSMGLFLARGGYFGGKSLGDQGDEYTEYTAFGELHQRIPVKGGLMLSHRLRSELRWLGKDTHDFSTRLRYRLMLEREFGAGHISFVPYVNVEPYYDSRYDTVNRVRVVAGSSISWWSHAAVELSATYQHDTKASTKDVLALGVILHVFFDTSRDP